MLSPPGRKVRPLGFPHAGRSVVAIVYTWKTVRCSTFPASSHLSRSSSSRSCSTRGVASSSEISNLPKASSSFALAALGDKASFPLLVELIGFDESKNHRRPADEVQECRHPSSQKPNRLSESIHNFVRKKLSIACTMACNFAGTNDFFVFVLTWAQMTLSCVVSLPEEGEPKRTHTRGTRV